MKIDTNNPSDDEIFSFILPDKATTQLTIQADRIHLFDTVNVNTCEETCQVEDIVGTVFLDSHGLDSGCDLQQCCRCCFQQRPNRIDFFF